MNLLYLASSRHSSTWGAAQKTVCKKIKKCGKTKRFLSPLFFKIFSHAVLCAAPQLTECLEEAYLTKSGYSQSPLIQTHLVRYTLQLLYLRRTAESFIPQHIARV